MKHSRVCGECSACCVTHAVKRLKKTFEPCRFLGGSGGCGIYEDRPAACQSFVCAWLQGDVPEEYRPDRTGLVPYYGNAKGPLSVAEVWPGSSKEQAGVHFIQVMEEAGHEVVVNTAADEPILRPNPFDLL